MLTLDGFFVLFFLTLFLHGRNIMQDYINLEKHTKVILHMKAETSSFRMEFKKKIFCWKHCMPILSWQFELKLLVLS